MVRRPYSACLVINQNINHNERKYVAVFVNCDPCIFVYLLTYFLTPYSRVLLEKLTGFQLVKESPAYYGTAVTSARQLSLSGARSIQSIPSHPTS